MSANDPHYESMLFNYETTIKSDYRNGAILQNKRTVYEEKPKCLWVRPPPLKDIHTLTDWKTPYIRIDLFVSPKEVLHSDPKKIQKRYVKIEDVDKSEARRARPRLVMTPAVSLDDIDDPQKLELLTKEMYTTTAKMAPLLGTSIATEQEKKERMKAPLHGTLSAPNPFALQKLQFPYVSPEWRMDSASWDSRQLRSYYKIDKY